jgi:hypothetical protein
MTPVTESRHPPGRLFAVSRLFTTPTQAKRRISYPLHRRPVTEYAPRPPAVSTFCCPRLSDGVEFSCRLYADLASLGLPSLASSFQLTQIVSEVPSALPVSRTHDDVGVQIDTELAARNHSSSSRLSVSMERVFSLDFCPLPSFPCAYKL